MDDHWISAALSTYADTVYRLASVRCVNKSDAEDIFQEVFLKLSEANPDFESEDHLKAWLIRVTINASRSLWRSPGKRRVVPLTADWPSTKEPAPWEEDLRDLVARLPKRYRSVIHLFYYEEMTVQEIGKILRLKPSTVRTQLTRGRKMLRKSMESGEEGLHGKAEIQACD